MVRQEVLVVMARGFPLNAFPPRRTSPSCDDVNLFNTYVCIGQAMHQISRKETKK